MARVEETLVELPFPDLASSLPIADRTSLVGLSPNDIRAWTSARADEYLRSARALFSIYNAVAPIHSLPAEILSRIFEKCWTGRKSLRVGHVCRRWHSVLLDSKRFWAHAVNAGHFTPDDHSTGYLGTVLQRSAPRTIEPSFFHFSAGVPECLALHAERVVSLEVACITHLVLSPLWSCLNSGTMPCLATLTITLDNDSYRSIVNAPIEDLSLSPAALPRLTRISAPVALFPTLGLPSLRHVTLDNPIKHEFLGGRLESERFCKAFTVCAPGLHTLTLIGAAPYTTATPLSLPALCHLHVQDTARCCSLLLLHLALSPTTCIHCTNVDGLGLRTTVPIASDAVRSTVGATDRVVITSTTETTSLHCYGGDEERLRVDIPFSLTLATVPEGAQAAPVLRPDSLIEFFRDRARVTGLTVVGENRADMEMVEWRAFPHLVAATLRGQKAGYAVENLARWQLGDGEGTPAHWQAGGSPATTVVCPGLKTLAVDFQFVLGAQRTDGLGSALALRGGDVAGVEADLRKRCADLERALSFRSETGTRLERLEFGCTEQGWSEGVEERKGTLDPLNSDWTSWRAIVEPLEKLVDGPVVFTGYRYLLM
ncbi:hypothetical protein GSI_04667 [Ganoderma sinense ZZ0214-1]|uniref:F-box domain-containing protein n=1 Tax=Ganoderma sinense ZZ0214-1 TaxID=1077348 RepID=A0A2G8SHM5_9APHY|nr:hypothetical protein GSI_04667 [Ganoderma sinense ZZ0214-1]